MERELMGREEVEPPVAIEVPAPVSQPVTSGDIMDSLTSRVNLGVTSVSELRGRENRHESRSQNPARHSRHSECDHCFLKTEEDAPMVTVLVAIDTVYKQMVAIPLEKEGKQRSICKSQSGRIRTIRRTSPCDHPRRLGARTRGSHPRRM